MGTGLSPGYNDADLQGIHTRLRESREQELRILTSQSTRDLLAANGVEVISYRELAALDEFVARADSRVAKVRHLACGHGLKSRRL